MSEKIAGLFLRNNIRNCSWIPRKETKVGSFFRDVKNTLLRIFPYS